MADEKPAEDVKTDEPISVEPDFSSLDEEQETPKESSPEAEPKEEPKEPEAEKEEAKAEPEETEEPAPSAEEPVEETKPLAKGEERKATLNTEIRDLVAQRNGLRTEVEKLNAETYKPASEVELAEQVNPETGAYYSSIEAKVEAMRQATELRDYNDRVTESQLTIESQANRVLQDFPMFNPDSEQYNKEIAADAAELVEANLIKDPNNGQVIGSNLPIDKIYKSLARAYGVSQAQGQIKGQEAAEKMMASADTGSSSAPEKKPTDPLMDILKSWDET